MANSIGGSLRKSTNQRMARRMLPTYGISLYYKEECFLDAKKYNTRLEWTNNSGSLQKYAYKHGLMDEACAHMRRPRLCRQEQEIVALLKEKFPSVGTKRFGTKNFGIPIKILELDMFIPELKKGIEFDGTYWHGKGFKRKGYTDVNKYHSDKDAFFLSLGIKVLHIKEADWLADKEACLKKAFDFLESP